MSDIPSQFHQPVLLTEVLTALNIRADGIYVDGTYGRGGHSRAILAQLSSTGKLIAFDQDPTAIQNAQQLPDPRFSIIHSDFAQLAKHCRDLGYAGRINGILLDLGVSSPQLDNAKRGFSFMKDGPLDMRMNPEMGDSVAQWLAKAKSQQIAEVLKTYGEERYAKRLANAIVAARSHTPLQTTKQLAEIIAAAHPAWEKDKHPATRSFQALRIFINQELQQLQIVLPQAIEVLAPLGRLIVISFHSLEDRIVKRFMRDEAKGHCDLPPDLPIPADMFKPKLRIIGKPIYPTEVEIIANPRARSAVLRVAEKC